MVLKYLKHRKKTPAIGVNIIVRIVIVIIENNL